MTDNETDEPLTIECDKHGTTVAAVVCRHLLTPGWRKVGFVENNDDPDDLQAWCEKCERLFNDFALVCTGCYAAIKKRHSS